MQTRSITVIPTPAAVDAAWERYAVLARRMLEDPIALTDRAHIEAVASAQRDFMLAFLALEDRR